MIIGENNNNLFIFCRIQIQIHVLDFCLFSSLKVIPRLNYTMHAWVISDKDNFVQFSMMFSNIFTFLNQVISNKLYNCTVAFQLDTVTIHKHKKGKPMNTGTFNLISFCLKHRQSTMIISNYHHFTKASWLVQ